MNPGRTGRRVIKVNGKDTSKEKNIVKGSLVDLLTELEYVISIIYARGTLEEGYDESVIRGAIDFCHLRGKDNAERAIEKFEQGQD